MKLSEKVPEILALAYAVGLYLDEELPKRLKGYPYVEDGEEVPPPPQREKLKEVLSSLPEEWLYVLLAVADLGSRGLRLEEWPAYRRRLAREWPSGRLLSGLAHRAALAEDLEDGLAKLKAGGLDLDALVPPSAVAV